MKRNMIIFIVLFIGFELFDLFIIQPVNITNNNIQVTLSFMSYILTSIHYVYALFPIIFIYYLVSKRYSIIIKDIMFIDLSVIILIVVNNIVGILLKDQYLLSSTIELYKGQTLILFLFVFCFSVYKFINIKLITK